MPLQHHPLAGSGNMLYLATASGPAARAAIAAGQLGQMLTPLAGNRLVPGAVWALDNGCFSDRWDMHHWSDFLDRYQPYADQCLWAVMPDVVGDAEATNRLWGRWHEAAMRRGFKAAYVAQPGCRAIPRWCEAVFLGGDTAWKYSAEAQGIAALAKAHGKWLHLGRVNSLRRLRYAAQLGCDSVDGTYLAFGPDANLPRLLRFLRSATEPTLFEVPA